MQQLEKIITALNDIVEVGTAVQNINIWGVLVRNRIFPVLLAGDKNLTEIHFYSTA